ncbi:MAG TPA: DUF4231 domain-containing protein [Acidimicrobiales bacterium]|nr:DUF4231 domain-containing protein [Acidimicrobiales bacterium]
MGASGLRRFELLAQWPRIGRFPPADGSWPGDFPVVPDGAPPEFPNLAADLELWRAEFEPRFRLLDHRAEVFQNRFRRGHVELLLGGLLATAMGAVQAANGGHLPALAAAQAVLTGLLAGLAVMVRSRRDRNGYLDCRLRAERMKSEFFLFLARAGDYAGDDPAGLLRARVDDIELEVP